jgi:hypothetical protein
MASTASHPTMIIAAAAPAAILNFCRAPPESILAPVTNRTFSFDARKPTSASLETRLDHDLIRLSDHELISLI